MAKPSLGTGALRRLHTPHTLLHTMSMLQLSEMQFPAPERVPSAVDSRVRLEMGWSPATRRETGGGGAGPGPLMRRDGADGSGQLSSNGDAQWELARIHALLREAHSDTSSNPAEGALSPPDSRLSSLARTGLPPVGERDERSDAAAPQSPHSHPLPAAEAESRPAAAESGAA